MVVKKHQVSTLDDSPDKNVSPFPVRHRLGQSFEAEMPCLGKGLNSELLAACLTLLRCSPISFSWCTSTRESGCRSPWGCKVVAEIITELIRFEPEICICNGSQLIKENMYLRTTTLQKCRVNVFSDFLCRGCREIWRGFIGRLHGNFMPKTEWKTENFTQISLCWVVIRDFLPKFPQISVVEIKYFWQHNAVSAIGR